MNKLERQQAVINVATRLLKAETDTVVPLSELSAIAGTEITGDRWIIGVALRAVNSEYGAVFATVRGEGYRRLAHGNGALFATERGLKRIRRASRSAMKLATNAVKFANDMSADQRRQHNQRMSALGLVEHLSMSRTVASLPEDPPPPANPLDGLRRAIGAD